MFSKTYINNGSRKGFDRRKPVSVLIGGCTFRVLETGMKGFCKTMPKRFPQTKFDTRVPVQRNYALRTPEMEELKERLGGTV